MLQLLTEGRLLRRFSNGKPTQNVVGINQVGKWTVAIAEWLGKPEPRKFSSHCLRRTAATLLAESGASLPMMKIAGGWSSSSVAEGYINTSKRTLQIVADGLGIGSREVSKNLAVSVVEDSHDEPQILHASKKRRESNENQVPNTVNNIAQQFTFGTVTNCTFYFGIPAPQAIDPPTIAASEISPPSVSKEGQEQKLNQKEPRSEDKTLPKKKFICHQ